MAKNIDLFGIIWSFEPDIITRKLPKDGDDVTVRIDSPGGDVFAMFAIYNMLKDHPGKVTIDVIGLAASAASFIAMAGDEIIMRKASQMMIHNPIAGMFGDYQDFEKLAREMRELAEQVGEIYADRTGLSPERVGDLLDAETWLTPAQAVDLGFADRVLEVDDAPAEADVEMVDYRAKWASMGIMNMARFSYEQQHSQPRNVSDAYPPTQTEGSDKMGTDKNGVFTTEHVNQIVEAERKDFEAKSVADFVAEHGFTPEEAAARAKAADEMVAESAKAAAAERVDLYCDKLADRGLALAIVGPYKDVRKAIAEGATGKMLAFGEGGDELAVGDYLDKLMETIVSAARAGSLLVPAGEKTTVTEPKEPTAELAELRIKWQAAIPKPADGPARDDQYDQDAIDRTVVAYEIQQQAGGPEKMSFSEALAQAPAKLAKMKA